MSNTRADVQKKCADLDGKLKGKLFLDGTKPGPADIKAFNDLLGAGNQNMFRWVKNVSTFSDAERAQWGAPYKPPKAPVKKEEPKKEEPKKEEPKKEEPKKEEPKKEAAEDDDMDLFGEETEEEKAALEAKKKKDAEAKAQGKPPAKSSILMDIKPWDDETNLKELAAKLIAVEHDGIVWGAQQLAPVAYGVKKLQQMIVIEDDKVSSDDLEDLIMGFEDYVQSCDIVAWNKV